jgi:hypothetical protein
MAESTSHPSAGFRLQSLNVPPQVRVHFVPSHPAVEFGPDGQAVPQLAPQLLTSLFSAHVAPHAWCVASHEKPQPRGLPPQVAVAKAGGVHGVHDVPQVAVLVFATHVLPQA